MSNLINITNKILEDGKAEVAKIKEKSEKNNKEIIDSRIYEANEKKDTIIIEANKEANMLKNRLKSEVALKVRDEKLKAKRNVLDKTFDLAKESLKNIDDDTYMDFFKKNLEGIKLKGSETFVIPEKYMDLIKESGLPISVSQSETIDSGFLVKDENIVINYSFESLIDFMKEDLEPEVAKILFEEKE